MADTPLGKRHQVIALHCHSTKTVREIASDLQISKSAVDRIIRRWKDTGNVESGKKGKCGRRRKLTNGDKQLLIREALLLVLILWRFSVSKMIVLDCGVSFEI
jgi:transposase